MEKKPMVGEEEVGFLCPDKDLPESKGAMAALKAKANFQHRPHLGDPIDIRRALIARRLRSGFNTPDGHTCSNLIEQIEGMFDYVRPEWAKDVRQTLPWLVNQQIKRLAAN